MSKRGIEFKANIGDIFKDEKRDLTIIDKEYRITNSGQKCKYYKVRCGKCGYESWKLESNLLTHKKGCLCCSNQIVVEGINDIPSTAPWMIKFFQGGKEEAKLYSKNSSKKINPICPICGNIKTNKVVIDNIFRNKTISCKQCGDGISYPEKIMYSTLKQLNIEFVTQYSPSWFGESKKSYDFYIPSLSCIIETHGKQHFKETTGVFATPLKKQQINDDIKKEMALKNKIKHYITIDCERSDLDYIKTNILNSKLSSLINLNNIDWDLCESFALNSLIKEICLFKENNKDISASQIGNIFNLSRPTIVTYLKKGSNIGWCNYNAKEEQIKNGRRNGKRGGILCQKTH